MAKKLVIFIGFFIICGLLLANFLARENTLIKPQILNVVDQTNSKKDKRFTRDASRTWPINDDTFALTNYDKEIAKDILNGGYIIVVRHAHREKWIDVTMYDALELLKNEDARGSYYENAVCLSKNQGIPQAMAIGEMIGLIKLPIGKIISSPSCRSRETATLGFGGYDEINTRLLHYYGSPNGPFDESVEDHFNEVKSLIMASQPSKGTNTIISAHNNTVRSQVVDGVLEKRNREIHEVDWLLEEGGFHVLKVVEGKLLFVTKFHNFQSFANLFFKRPDVYNIR